MFGITSCAAQRLVEDGRPIVASGGDAAGFPALPGLGQSRQPGRLGLVVLGALLALVAAALTPAPALADTKTWSGRLFLDTNWTTPSNWVGGVAPVPGDSLLFPSTAIRFTSNNDFPLGTTFNSITIASGGYTLTGNGVLLSNGTTATYATGLSTINLPISAFSSIINVTDAGATLVFAGTYNDNNGVQKVGLGTAVLQGISNAGAGWLVGTGVLNVQNGGAAGGGVRVAPSGTLQVEGSIALPVPITLDASTGANAMGGLQSVSGNNTLTGPITLITANSTMSVDAGSILTVSPNAVNLNNFTLTANVAGTATIASPIQGSGGLSKTGAGVLTLSGTNTYTGPTSVNAGTLLVNGSQSASSVTVSSGATLGGTGTTGPATINGILSPGVAGPGLLHSGNATFNGGSSFAVELNGTTVGTGYDELFAAGTLGLLGPTLTVSVGFASATGNTFTILQSTGALSGAFAGLPEGSTFASGGRRFRINYTANAATLTDVGSACILGDINCDGIVDIRDYGVWRQNFGQTNCGNPADLDGNCIVDIRDYGIWRQHFGEMGPAAR